MFWYWENTLILPEAFIWHVFRCVASALAFCNHGTNSGRRILGWDTIIHGDLKEDNIFLFTPDETENRLYPFVKLADLGMAITGPAAKFRKDSPGTRGYFPPEVYAKVNFGGRWQYPEPTDPSPDSDIWTLGLIIRRMISLINKFVPEHSARELIRRGYKRPFYSPALNRLVEACMQEAPSKRPKAHEVYEMASHFHEIHRRKLYKREEYSRQQNSPVYLGQVLFTDADKTRFNNQADFRTQYEEANCGPLRDWLGLSVWRKLDPEHGFIGPRESDLIISPPASHHMNPQQNTRLVLEDDRYKRWYAEYFEAAGAGLTPPQKPESLPTPDSATILVVNANWTNVPKARQQSISEGSSWFGHLPESPPFWTPDDYRHGELFIPKPRANPDAFRGVHGHRGDDDDDNDDGGGNGGNVNTASHVCDKNAVGGGGVDKPKSNRTADARSGTAHNNGAAGDAQHEDGRPIQHEGVTNPGAIYRHQHRGPVSPIQHGESVQPHQIEGPSQSPQHGEPIYQDQQGGVLHHPPPPQHDQYQGTYLHGGPAPHDQYGGTNISPPQFGGKGYTEQYGETAHPLIPPFAGLPNVEPSNAPPLTTNPFDPSPSHPGASNTHQPPTYATVGPGGPLQPSIVYTSSASQPQHQDSTVLSPENQPTSNNTTNIRHEKRARFASNVATQVEKGVEVLSKLDGRDGSQWRRERGLQGPFGRRPGGRRKSRGRPKQRAGQEVDEGTRDDEGRQEEQTEESRSRGRSRQRAGRETEEANRSEEGSQEVQNEEEGVSQGDIEMKW